MGKQPQKEIRVTRIVTIILLALGVSTTIWIAKVPDTGLSLAGSVLAVSMCYFFAGWAFGIYLSLKQSQASKPTN